jgi:serine/threonine-protein kinase SRPK3
MTAFWTEEEPTHELSTLTRIRDANPSHPGRRHCPSLIDHFRVKSHHGDHAVLVTPVSGPSLHSVRLNRPGIKPNPLNLHPLPITLVKKWLREMLLALDYLHTHVRIIHSGIPKRLSRVFEILTLSLFRFQTT